MEPIIREIPAGAEIDIQRAGDFIFVIDCGHTMDVLLGNQGRAIAEPGAMIRPQSRFPNFGIRNPDPDRPAFVRMIVGEGSYTSQIIQGEVTVNPGIKGEDGQFVDDTRSTIRLRAAFGNITPREYTEAGLIVEKSINSAAQVTALDDGRILTSNDHEDWKVIRWPNGEPEPLISLGTGSGVQVGPLLYIPDAENVPGLGYRLVINTYDAATLELRERLVTDAPWINKVSSNPIVKCLAFAANKFFIGNGQDRVDVVAVDGAQVGVIEVDMFARGLIVRGGLLHVLPLTATDPAEMEVFDPVTLARVDVSNAKLPDINISLAGAALTVRDTLLIGTNNGVSEYALDDVTISASGTVSACAGAGRFKDSQVDTVAQLYTQRLENGRVLASGELLKAVLELYTGRYMPADYLDYIYGVRADNLDGISPRIISTGGQSFKASGVADDAAGTFPQTIEITLREGLL